MNMSDGNQAILQDRRGQPVALRGVTVRARLRGLMAEVQVEQSYRNAQATNIEAVYTFPLPLGAVLLGLEVEIAGRTLTGTALERKQAERDYEDAVTDGDSAVMLEEAGPGLYTASLGNLMAGESAVIRYRYGLLLSWQGSRLRFLLPTTIAPRYGNPLAAGLQPHQVPISALDVEYPLDLTVAIDGELAQAVIGSPSHPVSTARTETGVLLRMARRGYLDRDFILTLEAERTPSVALLTADGDRQVALASLRIPEATGSGDLPLSLKVVIDCSGSMAGTSIAQARKAALEILELLRPTDHLAVTRFGSTHEHLFPQMVPCDQGNLAAARGVLENLEADLGGTEMEKALDAVFGLPGREGEPTILLITDGEIHEHERLVKRARAAGHRCFVVGVGSVVAETFLRSLADATGGACELVAPQEGMAERVLAQFHRMRQPRLSGLQVVWPGEPVWQTSLPGAVFGGDTVHVFAGFAAPVTGEVRLNAGPHFESVASLQPAPEPEVPRLAAAARLVDASQADGLRLALDYQLLSRWTNYLVVAQRADKAQDLPQVQVVPQMLAAGWGGTGTPKANVDAAYMSARSHSAAVDRYDVPAFLRRSASPPVFGGFVDSYDDVPFELESSAHLAVEPRTFIAALEDRLSKSQIAGALPDRLSDLESLGLPPGILEALREQVDAGVPESVLVAAFLQALANCGPGGGLSRSARRTILKNWKSAAPTAELDAQMRRSLEHVDAHAWNWVSTNLEVWP